MIGSQGNTQITNWIEKIIDRLIHILQNDTVKKKIQIQIVEPFLNYILERCFPYVMLLCIIFGIFLILLISIFIFLVWNRKASG
uniref:Uncharacterized protein n=1 Tax=viral metagenome TaxID=1070528 RepID=A0A6C0DPQ4_9ZZZZ